MQTRTKLSFAPRLLIAGGLLLSASVAPLSLPVAHAQDVKATDESLLASVSMPEGTLLVAPGAVPREVTDALKEMMKAGGDKVKRGKTEVFAWTGNGYKKSKAPALKAKIGAALKRAGWEYTEGEKLAEAPGFTMVSAMRTTPSRQALIGFWADTDEALMLAWTQMLPNTAGTGAAPATNGERSEGRPNTGTAKVAGQVLTKSALTGVALPAGARKVADLEARAQALTSIDSCLSHAMPGMHGKGLGPIGSTLEVVEWKNGPTQDQFNALVEKAGFNSLDFIQDKEDPSLSFVYFTRFVNGVRHEYGGVWSGTDSTRMAWAELTINEKTGGDDALGDDAPGNTAPAVQDEGTNGEANEHEVLPPIAKPVMQGAPTGAAAFDVGDKASVNVMKNAMPTLPSFPVVAAKPGYVRGYVKDSHGKPLKGACIGVSSTAVGGAATGATTKTDAKGYYELMVPFGVARFYNSGYVADYSEGIAALGLYPSDGEADEFASAQGAVKNWVLLPYGIANRGGAQEQPQYLNNYYGGSVTVNYEKAAMYGKAGIPSGSTLEITLTPQGALFDGSQGKSFVVRKAVTDESSSWFIINNIPIGTYKMSAALAGKRTTLGIKEIGQNRGKAFGIEPKEAIGSTTLAFRPYSAQADHVGARTGNWAEIAVDVNVAS